MRHVAVLVATSYPRFPGDGIGSFMEPIAKGLAARGHEIHLVAPWHPLITRGKSEDGVHFHFFHYAPTAALHVFGYATSLRSDTALKASAWLMTPAAIAAGMFKARRVAMKKRATILHGHWIVPGGVLAAAAGSQPLVVSAHGSDVFVAEKNGAARLAARRVLRRAAWVTACSDDLRTRSVALGAPPDRTETVPYGVDTDRFAPSATVRADVRRELNVSETAPVVVSAGRLVHKKGFEYLIDAAGSLRTKFEGLRLVIAGGGDLEHELKARAAPFGTTVIFTGTRTQDEVGRLVAAADVAVVPSVHDEAGNVDGLPNFALEALATATPVVATRVGGLPQAIEDGRTGRLVAERDAGALSEAIAAVLTASDRGRAMGANAREAVARNFGWARTAERFEAVYDKASRC